MARSHYIYLPFYQFGPKEPFTTADLKIIDKIVA